MKRLLRVLGWILGVLVAAWLGVCAYFAVTHPRVTFTAEELARPAAPLPKGFLWGTATAAHQIEGGNNNDWTRFEAQPGAIERGETSAVSADHWNRMAEDVALIGSLFLDQFWNWAFADAVRDGRARLRLPGATLDERIDGLVGSVDFFGLNYYFRYFVRLAPSTPEIFAMEPGPGLRSELGGTSPVGDSPPEALFLLMREAWKRYRLPIYVTEGGIADDKGTMRGPLIRGQVEAIQRARAEGVAVEGYFHWSLMDNFEWEKGFRPRFGLYRVDRQTLARTPAGGSEVFAALAPQ
jgi:beta-glucosidase/6-phospho-beta-glucosidase/beta-galactosidase